MYIFGTWVAWITHRDAFTQFLPQEFTPLSRYFYLARSDRVPITQSSSFWIPKMLHAGRTSDRTHRTEEWRRHLFHGRREQERKQWERGIGVALKICVNFGECLEWNCMNEWNEMKLQYIPNVHLRCIHWYMIISVSTWFLDLPLLVKGHLRKGERETDGAFTATFGNGRNSLLPIVICSS